MTSLGSDRPDLSDLSDRAARRTPEENPRMSRSVIGLLAGLLLTVVIVSGGFTGLLLAIILGAVGYVVGLQLDGDVDVRSFLKSNRD